VKQYKISKNKLCPIIIFLLVTIQRNIRMSFTPFSSNQKISFCNTIMIPFILSEESIDNEKI